MKLGVQVGHGPGHIVLHVDTAHPRQRCTALQLSTHICCGRIPGWINMPLGMEVGLGPGDFVLDGDPAPLPKRGQSPQFSAYFYCGQTGGPLPRPHCARRRPSSPQKGAQSPAIFGPCLLWPNGWMDQDATWYGGRHRRRRHCVIQGPSYPSLKGQCPQFSAHVRCG